MKRIILCFAAFVWSVAPSAFAQVTVFGNGLAKDCYEAVKYGKISPSGAESICTKALLNGSLKIENRSATFINRGIARMRDSRFDAALSDYAAAERLNADEGIISLNRGAALIYAGDLAAAIKDINLAIELDVDQLHAAFYNRAIAREYSGDVQGAYFDFKKSLELNPDFDLAQRQLERFTVTRTN